LTEGTIAHPALAPAIPTAPGSDVRERQRRALPARLSMPPALVATMDGMAGRAGITRSEVARRLIVAGLKRQPKQ